MRALYYPEIDLPNVAAVRDALLFWDGISTIAPSAVPDPYQGAFSRNLAARGLLMPTRVERSNVAIGRIATRVGTFMKTAEGRALLRDTTLGVVPMHVAKGDHEWEWWLRQAAQEFPPEVRAELVAAGYGDDWIPVTRGFERFYLTLLAGQLARDQDIVPFTPDSEVARLASQSKWNLSTDSGFSSGEARRLAHCTVVELSISAVSTRGRLSIDEVLKFKGEHADELREFHHEIGIMTRDLGDSTDGPSIVRTARDSFDRIQRHAERLDRAARKRVGFAYSNAAIQVLVAVPVSLLTLTSVLPGLAAAGLTISLTAVASAIWDEKTPLGPGSYISKLRRHI